MLTACALCGKPQSMDYEALGRYTDAIDRAQKYANDFMQRFKQFSDDVGRVKADSINAASHIPEFDPGKLRAHLDELTKLHDGLTELAREANMQADRCGKPKITTGRGPSVRPV